MNSHKLPFATIDIIRDDIAEVRINDGFEMDEKTVEQYHSFLLSHLHAPFSLLINKVNAYSYSFGAQEKLATIKEIRAMAVVTYSQGSKDTTELLASIPRNTEWNLNMFSDRTKALNWLLSQQNKTAK